jgi:hypothetical protein
VSGLFASDGDSKCHTPVVVYTSLRLVVSPSLHHYITPSRRHPRDGLKALPLAGRRVSQPNTHPKGGSFGSRSGINSAGGAFLLLHIPQWKMKTKRISSVYNDVRV